LPYEEEKTMSVSGHWRLSVVVGSALLVGGALSVALLSRSRATSPGENSARTSSPGPARVKVMRPQRAHLQRSTTQPAHVDAYEKVDVFAKAPGYLEALGQVKGADGRLRNLDIGDRVSAKQLLAVLWAPEVEQERQQKAALVEQARAEINQAEAAHEATKALVSAAEAKVTQARAEIGRLEGELAYRKSDYERYKRLHQDRTVQKELVEERLNRYRAATSALVAGKAAVASAQANQRVEEARQTKAGADVTSAKARLKVAEANLAYARIMVEYARVPAPFPGVLSRRHLDPGAFVQSATTGRATPLFTLVRTDRLRIVADVPEADARWVKLGQAATLRVEAARGKTFTGRVVRFSDALDTSTRTMRVEVELSGATELRPGLFGSVSIVLADVPNALTLPTNALVPSGEKPAVMVVREGRARRQEIVVGMNDGIRMEVLGGVSAADLVITDGKDALRDGQAVDVVP
jgi:RND family efflux transporter MFP subunit